MMLVSSAYERLGFSICSWLITSLISFARSTPFPGRHQLGLQVGKKNGNRAGADFRTVEAGCVGVCRQAHK